MPLSKEEQLFSELLLILRDVGTSKHKWTVQQPKKSRLQQRLK